MIRLVYPGEVTHNVIAGPRSGIRGRPNFFGRPAHGLRGLGFLGALPLGVPGVQFENDTAGRDFINGYNTSPCDQRGGIWPGADGALINNVAAKLEELTAAASYNPSAQGVLDEWLTTANRLAGQISQAEHWAPGPIATFGLFCGRSDAGEAAYKAAHKALKSHLQLALSIEVPAPSSGNSKYIVNPVTGSTGYRPTGSTGNQLVVGSGNTFSVAGIPTWLKVAGGVVLLGGAAYAVSRYMKKR